MANRTVEREVSIDASTEAVWEILSDVERWYEWTPSIKSILLLDPKPLHLGSTALIEQPRLPRAKWQVTEIDPVAGSTGKRTASAPALWVNTGLPPILKAESKSRCGSGKAVGWPGSSSAGLARSHASTWPWRHEA